MNKTSKATKNKFSYIPSPVLRVFLLWLVPFLILTSYLFAQALKSSNYLEIFPSEFILPLFFNSLTSFFIALTIYFIKVPHGLSGKIVTATILAFWANNFDSRFAGLADPIRSITPNLLPKPPNDIPFISIILILAMFVIAILIGVIYERIQKKYARLNQTNTLGVIFIVAGFVFFSQFIRVLNILPTILEQSRTTLPDTESVATAGTEKPDIYYIVYDRYTNENILKEQFDFDNSDFTNYLKSQNFSIFPTAQAHYPFTTASVASTLEENYHKESIDKFLGDKIQSRTLFHNLIYNSRFIDQIKKAGYRYEHIGSWYGATNKAPQANKEYVQQRELALLNRKHLPLRGLEETFFAQSPYRSLFSSSFKLWPIKHVQRSQEVQLKEQFNALDEIADSPNQGGRFIFAHILSPHDPYIFNADGSISSYQQQDNNGITIKTKYTNQITYLNTLTRELIDKINKNSNGQAVIILNSDEGPYPEQLNSTFKNPPPDYSDVELTNEEDMRDWPDDWIKLKFGILQAVRIPQATEEDLAKVSSVNIFRIVENRYFGGKLEYLPDCHYGLPYAGGRVYIFTDFNERLGLNQNEECKKYETYSGS